MKFKLEQYHRNVSKEELINDIIRVKKILNKDTLSYRDYDSNGKYSSNTIIRRFETWNNALQLAGITLNVKFNISEEELFDNLEKVWIKLGDNLDTLK